MVIYNMEARWLWAGGPGVATFLEINQPSFDTFALVNLTKTRRGERPGAGGYCGIASVDGSDLSEEQYPPAQFKYQMRSLTVALVSEGQYAQCMVTLMRDSQ